MSSVPMVERPGQRPGSTSEQLSLFKDIMRPQREKVFGGSQGQCHKSTGFFFSRVLLDLLQVRQTFFRWDRKNTEDLGPFLNSTFPDFWGQ